MAQNQSEGILGTKDLHHLVMALCQYPHYTWRPSLKCALVKSALKSIRTQGTEGEFHSCSFSALNFIKLAACLVAYVKIIAKESEICHALYHLSPSYSSYYYHTQNSISHRSSQVCCHICVSCSKCHSVTGILGNTVKLSGVWYAFFKSTALGMLTTTLEEQHKRTWGITFGLASTLVVCCLDSYK